MSEGKEGGRLDRCARQDEIKATEQAVSEAYLAPYLVELSNPRAWRQGMSLGCACWQGRLRAHGWCNLESGHG